MSEQRPSNQRACKKHPRYKAIRPPTADCEACRVMYARKHGLMLTPAQARAYHGDIDGDLEGYDGA
jgi:hypothetical protein